MTAVCYRFDSLWVGARKLNWMEVSCKTTEKPKISLQPQALALAISHDFVISSLYRTSFTPRTGPKITNLSSTLTSYSFPFLRCFMAIIRTLGRTEGTAVCGAQVVGKSLHKDGFSVSDLTLLMWGGSCKSGWNNYLSRFSLSFFLVTRLTDILRDLVPKGREYVLFYRILCLLFAGLLEVGGISECSLFTFFCQLCLVLNAIWRTGRPCFVIACSVFISSRVP